VAVKPAVLRRPEVPEGTVPYAPAGGFQGDPSASGFVEDEWFASGEVDGHRYTTSVFVRRPRDASRFSGTVVIEPLHAMGAAPIWIYTSSYIMRSGHAWACVCSQRSALEAHVKPSSPQRYASLDIWSGAPTTVTGTLLNRWRQPMREVPVTVGVSEEPASTLLHTLAVAVQHSLRLGESVRIFEPAVVRTPFVEMTSFSAIGTPSP
jgi:hypothetical protein